MHVSGQHVETLLKIKQVWQTAFANWIIEHKLGDFRQENTHVFISELYVPTVGEAVMVPIAEVEN